MIKRNIILFALLLTIGFASVATNLVINGNTKVGYDENNFKSNVVFTKAETLTGTAVINGNEKNIDFESIKLENINQNAILYFDVANKSREYDSSVTITCGLKDEFVSFNEYLDINMSLSSPFDLLAGETKSGELTVTLKKAYDQALQTTAELKCTLTATPIERDTKGNEYVKPPYKDIVLNGADPVLDDEEKLVPVKIENDGTVRVADTTEEWYNYTNKEWANAVILNDGVTHATGDAIPETDIESYFVWIPRYKYQIFDEGKYTNAVDSKPTASIAKEIKVEFESRTVLPSTGSTKDSWLTHPAFTNFDVNGLWVGKFETGYAGANTKEEAAINEVKTDKVVIKPNTYSWRGSSLSNMFKTAYNYERNLDSHMMKNTEWGAVAYLSHSKYGINTEVRINNNSSFLTGYAGFEKGASSSTDITKTLPYNTETGYKASTTGNITGIYDMSGGTLEYVAGYRDGNVGGSEFTTEELTTYSKYLDVYPSDSDTYTYDKRILGDATGEMGPFYSYEGKDGVKGSYNNWYGTPSYFVDFFYPWFRRGGSYSSGIYASQFYVDRSSGSWHGSSGQGSTLASSTYGSRLVLAAKD